MVDHIHQEWKYSARCRARRVDAHLFVFIDPKAENGLDTKRKVQKLMYISADLGRHRVLLGIIL